MKEENNEIVSAAKTISVDYEEILQRAVAVIENARTSVARHLATTASNTYWEIGKLLHEKKLESKHGSEVVKRLSSDLKERYPKMGMSPRNLWYMKTFYERYNGCDLKLQRSVALLPWSHNILILSKDLDDSATLYYAQEGVAKGWNRDLLLNALKLKMHEKDNVEVALSLEDMSKPIGVADYQLIIPKEELQKTISAEIHSFELEQAVKEQQKKKEDVK